MDPCSKNDQMFFFFICFFVCFVFYRQAVTAKVQSVYIFLNIKGKFQQLQRQQSQMLVLPAHRAAKVPMNWTERIHVKLQRREDEGETSRHTETTEQFQVLTCPSLSPGCEDVKQESFID